MNKIHLLLMLLIVVLLAFTTCDNNRGNKTGLDNINGEDNKQRILGKWRLSEDEFVSMIIKSDSIYYPDQQSSVSYRQIANTIVTFDDDKYTDTIKYDLRGRDTLIFFIVDQPQVYVRNAAE